MTVLRLLILFTFGALLTGCIFADVEKLKNDVHLFREYLKASPLATKCSQPGRDQDIVCNYKLVIWRVNGEVYRGYIAPQLVEDGIKACNDLKNRSAEDSDLSMYLKGDLCPTDKEHYEYELYEFKIANPGIPDSIDSYHPVDLVNVPHGPYMQKGHIEVDMRTNLPLR